VHEVLARLDYQFTTQTRLAVRFSHDDNLFFAGGFGQAGDQRHRAVVNGVWEIGAGVHMNGIHVYGSGSRHVTTTGLDRRNEGGGTAVPSLRLRADGSILPRIGFIGDPIHRVDMRLPRDVLRARA
jgi:hypothetical protein